MVQKDTKTSPKKQLKVYEFRTSSRRMEHGPLKDVFPFFLDVDFPVPC